MIQTYRFLFGLLFTACITGCNSATETTKPNIANESTYKPVTGVKTSKGQKMFRDNCQGCHLFDKNLVAPPVANLAARWNNKKDLYAYMRDPMEYINTRNDQRIIKLHKEYKIIMPPFSFLKEAEFDSIFQYLKTYDTINPE